MLISEKLIQLQLIGAAANSTIDIFDKLYSDIFTIPYTSESDLVNDLWLRYKSQSTQSNSLGGKVFEGILATILFRSKILPIYVEANITFVPNVNFDFVLYSKEHGPIILSAKTSLRERYKQADLEGMMLRHVHRRSKSYLITLDSPAAKTTNKKIHKGFIFGLDEVVVANDKTFDKLIAELKLLNFYTPPKLDVLTSQRLIR